jgi:hypothetical protein
MHLCPTRADGAPVLFAHMITVTTCQSRQRAHYHKCPTCVYENSRLGQELSIASSSEANPPPTPGPPSKKSPPKNPAASKVHSVRVG